VPTPLRRQNRCSSFGSEQSGGAGGGIPNNGDVTVALACERALELFTPIDEREYVGYNGSLGRKGYDESVLAQYHIVDDPKRTAPAQDADADPDEPVCLHETVEPYEDEPARGACADCGADFDLTGAETEAQRTE
jgi:hypothetical protein